MEKHTAIVPVAAGAGALRSGSRRHMCQLSLVLRTHATVGCWRGGAQGRQTREASACSPPRGVQERESQRLSRILARTGRREAAIAYRRLTTTRPGSLS